MKYSMIVIGESVTAISDLQYNTLKANGHKTHGNQYDGRTVYVDRVTADKVKPVARLYWHHEYHVEYPDGICYYAGCKINNEEIK